jgi:hypothetical protein
LPAAADGWLLPEVAAACRAEVHRAVAAAAAPRCCLALLADGIALGCWEAAEAAGQRAAACHAELKATPEMAALPAEVQERLHSAFVQLLREAVVDG